MKLETLTIKNFRSIKGPLTVLFSDTKTVLVGKNNSGKTNILKALEILLGEKWPYYFDIEEKDFFDPKEKIEIKAVISGITKEDYENFLFRSRSEKTDKGRITASGGKVNLVFTAEINNGNITKEFRILTDRNPPNVGADFQSSTDDFRKSLCTFMFVPADRNIDIHLKPSSYNWYGKLLTLILHNQKDIKKEEYQKLVYNLKAIEQNFKNLIDDKDIINTSKLITYIEDIKFSLTKSQQPEDLLKAIEILVKGGKNLDYFELARMGTGTQSAIMIGLFDLYIKTFSQRYSSALKIFAIDEPENFLHPQGKRLIDNLLDQISSINNNQVIYITQSPELISNFNDNFKLSNVVYTYKNQDDSTLIKQFTEQDNQEFSKVQQELNAENSEIFFADRVLLVDGQTEKHSIPNIFKFNKWRKEDLSDDKKEELDKKPDDEKEIYVKRYFDLDYRNISIINVGGKQSIRKYYKFACKLLSKENVWVLFDKDRDFDKDKEKIIEASIKEIWNVDDVKKGDFQEYNWLILEEGEFENYYKVDKLAEFLGIDKTDVENFILEKKKSISKYSKIIEDLFKEKMGDEYTKPTIAFRLSKYLIENDGYKADLIKILKEICN